MESLIGKRVAIISHVYSPGPPHELEAYLKDKVRELFFIAHPFGFIKNRASHYQRFKHGKLVEDRDGRVWGLPEFLLYAKDFVANIFLLWQPRYDLIIALDNLNAASAIWLRAFGRTKQVVFYTIDYIPQRFPNPWLNRLYHSLDSYCVKRADYVWNLSPVMSEMREKKGIDPKYRAKQLVVPIGTHILPQQKVKKDPHLVIFMGHLRPGQGVELLLDAMPAVLTANPKAKLRLIGGGPLEATVREKVKRLKLDQSVELTGFVPTNEAMRSYLASGTIAVAPYIDDETTFTRYTDPGKPKEYLAAGLPVIITRVPQFAEVIEAAGAGKAVAYDKQELAEAIISLLGSNNIQQFQRKARQLASKYTWDKVFRAAFGQMGYE